jgi:hypothetical protein
MVAAMIQEAERLMSRRHERRITLVSMLMRGEPDLGGPGSCLGRLCGLSLKRAPHSSNTADRPLLNDSPATPRNVQISFFMSLWALGDALDLPLRAEAWDDADSRVGDHQLPVAAFKEAVKRRPGRIVVLRQKTRVLADSRRSGDKGRPRTVRPRRSRSGAGLRETRRLTLPFKD